MCKFCQNWSACTFLMGPSGGTCTSMYTSTVCDLLFTPQLAFNAKCWTDMSFCALIIDTSSPDLRGIYKIVQDSVLFVKWEHYALTLWKYKKGLKRLTLQLETVQHGARVPTKYSSTRNTSTDKHHRTWKQQPTLRASAPRATNTLWSTR